ncbi:MAG: hypothetical protein JOY82_09560 [Streptosporangiaceae bacterium]|nr:hypothetical protein [Streptosporangiaceae bacterium]MBV9854759.1 hypothetical protein [Streptosporangiaceae bacterium]
MRYRATFIAGFAVGFVVGARAGRERYEQLMKYGRQAAQSPAVQQATRTVTTKTTEITKTAASQVPRLVESAKNKAGGRFDHFPGRGARNDDGAAVNGARYTDGNMPN